MEKKQIVRFIEDGETWLDYSNEYDRIVDTNPCITIEEYADFHDQSAESKNHHAFVGTHRALAVILCNAIGYAHTLDAMCAISEYGGLDEMNTKAVFDELGLPDSFESFCEWKVDEVQL